MEESVNKTVVFFFFSLHDIEDQGQRPLNSREYPSLSPLHSSSWHSVHLLELVPGCWTSFSVTYCSSAFCPSRLAP